MDFSIESIDFSREYRKYSWENIKIDNFLLSTPFTDHNDVKYVCAFCCQVSALFILFLLQKKKPNCSQIIIESVVDLSTLRIIKKTHEISSFLSETYNNKECLKDDTNFVLLSKRFHKTNIARIDLYWMRPIWQQKTKEKKTLANRATHLSKRRFSSYCTWIVDGVKWNAQNMNNFTRQTRMSNAKRESKKKESEIENRTVSTNISTWQKRAMHTSRDL